MTAGFPTKANWAAGDLLTASAMDDLAGTVNLVNPTSKGGIISASAANTPSLLSVGADGTTLVADSSTTTGLRYQGHIEAGKNFLINGAMDIWQRGTSANQNAFSADRWYGTTGSATATYARESTIVPTGAQYSMKWTHTTTSSTFINQAIETSNAVRLAGQTVTYSFKAATSSSVNVNPYLYYSTSTDVGVTGSWTQITATSISSVVVNGTSSFTTVYATYAVPSTAKSLMVGVGVAMTSSLSVYIGDTQLELGSVPTTFSRNGATLQGELAACQRYFWQAGGNAVYQGFGNGIAQSTTVAQILVKNPVSMRAVPTTHAISNLGLTDTVSTTAITASVIAQAGINENLFQFTVTAGLVLYRPYILNSNNTTNAYINVSAEL